MKKLRPVLYIGIAVVCLLDLIFAYPSSNFFRQPISVFDAVCGFAGWFTIILFSERLARHGVVRNTQQPGIM